ncbi:hypothetical protein BBEV_2532 [Salisediminibacterium beveridgei]|uniref:Uncharacterized protein n=1 Tax=Salisediminibacterium beveridgei TaxID=632773 RepID=A0A1D7QXY1_9BACI|nr:hypothetical protein BBEV_2532 [Salisediminibacterium beveridgei]
MAVIPVGSFSSRENFNVSENKRTDTGTSYCFTNKGGHRLWKEKRSHSLFSCFSQAYLSAYLSLHHCFDKQLKNPKHHAFQDPPERLFQSGESTDAMDCFTF